MKDADTLEVLSTKGRFEIPTSPDCTLAELRAKIGQEILQTESSNVSLIARGKIAPVDGTLAEFLPNDNSSHRTIFAVCLEQRNKTPHQAAQQKAPQQEPSFTPETLTETEQEAKPSARDEVLKLMPEHIREELADGETRLNDVVSSWEQRMRENPEVTKRHLKSKQTQDLLESLRAPMRSKSGCVPSIGVIDTEALISRPSDHKLMRGSCEISGPQGILRDIQFQNMLTEQWRSMIPPSTGRIPEDQPVPPPLRPAQVSGLKVDSKEVEALLQNSKNPEAVEAFNKIRESLRLIQEQEPQLLRALVDIPERSSVSATSGNAENVEVPTKRKDPKSSNSVVDITQPSMSSDLPADGLQALQELQKLMRLREMVSGGGGGGSGDDSSGLRELLGGGNDSASFLELLGGGGGSSEEESDKKCKRKYSVQLQHLRDMGFSDEAANLKAIKKTKGNLDAAIDRLNKD